MSQEWWAEPVIAKATEEILSAKMAMGKVINRPILRRPNTKDIMREAAVAPQNLPIDARERIMAMLQSRYGEQAQNVAPYILGEDPEAQNYG